MKIINLTPHEINIFTAEGGKIKIPPSGTVARVSVQRQKVGEITVDGKTIPIHKNVYGEVENLPDPKPDTIYIVSSLVAQAVPHREDVLIPDDAVRDAEGKIIGVKGLAHV